jgi:adenylate cyclase
LNGERVERRLAAVLAADVAGSSRLMGRDEERTLAQLKSFRKTLVDPTIAAHRGRIVKTTGDGMLVEFASAVDAARCAMEVQCGMAGQNADVPLDVRIEFRIGIHVGDIIIDDNDIFGDGVNIAARLEGIAEPGGICMSDDAYRQVRGKVDTDLDDMGVQTLKNIAEPMRAWRMRLSGTVPPTFQTGATEKRPALPLPDKPSIAVLPFQNMSGDPEQEYFADGMVEDITTALSRIRWLFVIARNSSFVFKGKAFDIKEVGDRLGVRYVLEGSTRRSANRVRITAQLIEVATGSHIWADRYDGTLDEIFDLQDQITRAVVGAIEPTLQAVEIARSQAKPTNNLDAYDLYLRALSELRLFTEAGFQNAEVLLNEALKRDPNLSSAWATLADCTARRTIGGWHPDWNKARNDVCRAALKAVEADPENGIALSIAAFRISQLSGQLERAEEFANRALALQPNSATVCVNCGWFFIMKGDYAKALRYLELARLLNPIDPEGYVADNGIAAVHFCSNRFSEAEASARRAIERWPLHPVSTRWLIASLVQLNRLEEARTLVSELLAKHPKASIRQVSPYMRSEVFLSSLKAAGLPE